MQEKWSNCDEVAGRTTKGKNSAPLLFELVEISLSERLPAPRPSLQEVWVAGSVVAAQFPWQPAASPVTVDISAAFVWLNPVCGIEKVVWKLG